MREAIKPFKWAALVLLVIAGASLAAQAQQGAAAGARKRILFLTYPGVGHPALTAIYQASGDADAGPEPADCRRVLHICDGAVE